MSDCDKIRGIVKETIEELKPMISGIDWEKLSRHNKGYLQYKNHPSAHLETEIIRYIRTAGYIDRNVSRSCRILEIGFFLPLMPVVLRKLGFEVSAIEKLSYYDGVLDEIIFFARDKYGIVTRDIDLILDDTSGFNQTFDCVLLLAILEHLNGTPRYLLNSIRQLLKPEGILVTDVPNAAAFGQRLRFLLKGQPPYPSFDIYYNSEYPFSGHNREYTVDDVEYALSHSGFEIIELDLFEHSNPSFLKLKGRLIRLLENLGPRKWKSNIWSVSRPRQDMQNDNSAG